MEIKLNVGCGRNLREGWVNIDNSPSAFLAKLPIARKILFRLRIINEAQADWSKDILWRDVRKRLPFKTNSVVKVYSSHMLEHLDREAGLQVLQECYRVLKTDGPFRLVVPDLAYHARQYLDRIADDSAGREPHDDFLFNVYGGYLNGKRYGAWHRYMYDWPTLRLMLRKVGFRQVLQQPYQYGIDSETAALDNRPEDSLHIDAVK